MNQRNRCYPSLMSLAAVGACTLLLALPYASLGQNKIYDSNGFEPRPFVAGAPLLGLDGWSTAIPPFLNPAAAVITAAASANGRQSVEVWGGDLVSSEGITAPYDAIGSYRRPVSYSVSPAKPIVIVEANLLLDTEEPATEDDFFSLTIAARSGDGETLGEMGLSSSGTAVAYDPSDPAGSGAAFTAPIAFNRWYRVCMALDFSGETTMVSYFLDGQFLGSVDTGSASKVLARGAMVVYALPDAGGDARANYTARFDNFWISVHGADE
jgi:hypothetical protein